MNNLVVTTSFVSPDFAGTLGTVTVTAKDIYGNTVGTGPNAYTGTVDLTSTDGKAGGLAATHAFAASDAGSYTFTGVALKTAGSQTITATDSIHNTLTGDIPVNVVAAAAQSLVVTTSFAATDLAGTAGTVTITALDAYSNRVGSGPDQYEGTIDLSTTDSLAAGLPSHYTFTAADAGSHTFNNVAMETVGNQTITAADAVSGTINGTSLAVTVVPTAVKDFVVSTSFVNPTVAGTVGTVTVTAEDQYGNTVGTGPDQYAGTVDLSTTDSQLTGLPSHYTFTTLDAGSHTFTNVVVVTAGSQNIAATDSVAGTLTGSATLNVVPAAVKYFVVTTSFASPDIAGTAGTVTVTAKDDFGNTVGTGPNQYAGAVSLSSTDGQATGLSTSYTFTHADAGSHSFTNVALATAGSQTITATDSVSNMVTGNTAVTVVPAAVKNLVVATSFANPDVAGSAGTVTVTAKDTYGNTAGTGPNTYQGTIDLSSTDGKTSGLPISYTFGAGDAGSHTFANVDLATAGSQTIMATDSVSNTITGTSLAVNVVPATVKNLVVATNFAATDVAGTTGTVTVTAKDTYGNTVGTGPNAYREHSRPEQYRRPGDGLADRTILSRPPTPGRTRSSAVALETAGSQTITATDSVSNTITGTSLAVTVVPAGVKSFVVTTSFAATDVAGTAGTVTVTAKDDFGNTVGSGPNQYAGTVELASTDSQVTGLPSHDTFTAADAGSHTFSAVVLATAGSQTITATDSMTSTVTGDAAVNVVPAVVKDLVVTTSFASPDAAGTAGTVTVTAKDAYGNTVGGGPNQYEGTVSLHGTDGKAAGLPASHTFTPADAGSYTFAGVVLKTAGPQTITATDSAHSNIVGDTTLTVTAANASVLIVTTPPPSSLTAGQTFGLAVSAEDPYGNVVPTFNGNVTVAVAGDAGFTTTAQAKNGVATFTGLTASTAAQGEPIQATGGGLSAAATSPESVTPSPSPTSTSTPTPTPTIIGEQVIFIPKKGKKGKPVLEGFKLEYSGAMNPSTAGLAANYLLTATTIKKSKKKTITGHTQVPLSAAFNSATNSVTLTIEGKQAFAKGGQITVIYAPPNGVSSAANVALDAGDRELTIAPNAKGISLGSS